MDLLPLLAAPFAGSFLGVLIRRLPLGRPWMMVRSACDGCGALLQARDLVPLASYAALRGRCRQCGQAIGRFHPAVELASVAIAAWAAWADPDRVWQNCMLGWGLLALAWIDLEHMRLPDALTLPLIPAGLAAAWWVDPALAGDHALAAASGYLLFRAVAWTYRRVRGREGLGQGDAKLLAAAGAWVGIEALPHVLLGAGLLGLGFAALRWRQAAHGAPVPLGPALALALWIVRLHGGG